MDALRSALGVPVQVSDDGSKVGVLTHSKQREEKKAVKDDDEDGFSDEGEKDSGKYPTDAEIALALAAPSTRAVHERHVDLARPGAGDADVAAALPAPPALALSGNARLHSRYEEGRVVQQRRLIEERERGQKPWAASSAKGAYKASGRITHLYEQGRVLQQRRLIEERQRDQKPRSAKSLPPRMKIPSDAEYTFAPKLATDYTLPPEVRAAQSSSDRRSVGWCFDLVASSGGPCHVARAPHRVNCTSSDSASTWLLTQRHTCHITLCARRSGGRLERLRATRADARGPHVRQVRA